MKIVVLHADGSEVLDGVERFKKKTDEHSTVVVEYQDGTTETFTSCVVVTGTLVANDEISAGKEEGR